MCIWTNEVDNSERVDLGAIADTLKSAMHVAPSDADARMEALLAILREADAANAT